VVELVEAHIGLDGDTRTRIAKVRIRTRDDGETLALRLPGEVEDSVLEFDNFDGVVLLPQSEDFKVAEDRLLGLGVTVDLDAKEVTLVLPVEFALHR
jgi:hypothetical protein